MISMTAPQKIENEISKYLWENPLFYKENNFLVSVRTPSLFYRENRISSYGDIIRISFKPFQFTVGFSFILKSEKYPIGRAPSLWKQWQSNKVN